MNETSLESNYEFLSEDDMKELGWSECLEPIVCGVELLIRQWEKQVRPNELCIKSFVQSKCVFSGTVHQICSKYFFLDSMHKP